MKSQIAELKEMNHALLGLRTSNHPRGSYSNPTDMGNPGAFAAVDTSFNVPFSGDSMQHQLVPTTHAPASDLPRSFEEFHRNADLNLNPMLHMHHDLSLNPDQCSGNHIFSSNRPMSTEFTSERSSVSTASNPKFMQGVVSTIRNGGVGKETKKVQAKAAQVEFNGVSATLIVH